MEQGGVGGQAASKGHCTSTGTAYRSFFAVNKRLCQMMKSSLGGLIRFVLKSILSGPAGRTRSAPPEAHRWPQRLHLHRYAPSPVCRSGG